MAAEPVHVVAATAEVQVVRALSNAPRRRRTPTVAVASGEVERRPVTPTGGRKKDTVAGWACNFIAVAAALTGPLPIAFVQQFL